LNALFNLYSAYRLCLFQVLIGIWLQLTNLLIFKNAKNHRHFAIDLSKFSHYVFFYLTLHYKCWDCDCKKVSFFVCDGCNVVFVQLVIVILIWTVLCGWWLLVYWTVLCRVFFVILGLFLGCVISMLFMCSASWLFLLGCQYQCKWLTGKTRLRNDL